MRLINLLVISMHFLYCHSENEYFEVIKDLTTRHISTNDNINDKSFHKCIAFEKLKEGNKIFGPHFVFSGEGHDISLSCSSCMPSYISPEEEIIWYKLTAENDIYKLIDSYKFKLEENDNSLFIKRSDKDDSATYYCVWNSFVFNIWTLEVLAIRDLDVAHQINASLLPTTKVIHNKLNIVITKDTSRWSSCNRCGISGKRHRFENCIVEIFDNSIYTQFEALEYYTHLSCVLFLFFHPEIATIDPLVIQRDLSKRPQIIIGFCKVSCDNFIDDPENEFKPVEIEIIYKTGKNLGESFLRPRKIPRGFLPPVSEGYWVEIACMGFLLLLEIYIIYKICKYKREAK